MSIDIDRHLKQTATKYVTTRNVFGDVVKGAASQSKCLYQNISTLGNSQSNKYDTNISGLLWFGAAENVKRGDIYLLDTGDYVQIQQILKAQTRVTDNNIKFIKCTVSLTMQVS